MTPARTHQGERQGVSPPSTPHGTALPVLQTLATYRMNENQWLVSDHSAMWQNAKNRTRRADALPLAGETLFHEFPVATTQWRLAKQFAEEEN